MSNLSRWFTPFDPRGMSIWGTVACMLLGYQLYQIQGHPSEIWPNRCHLLKKQFEDVLHNSEQKPHPLEVVFNPQPESKIKLWALDVKTKKGRIFPIGTENLTQDIHWFLPEGEYTGAQVRINQFSAVWVELIRKDQNSVMLTLDHDQGLLELYQYLTADYQLKYVNNIIQPHILNRHSLQKLALKTRPKDISCERELYKKNLPKALALLQKATEVGLMSAFLLNQEQWLLQKKILDRNYFMIKRPRTVGASSDYWSITWSTKGDNMIVKNDPFLPSWLFETLDLLNNTEYDLENMKKRIVKISPHVTVLNDLVK